MYNIIIYFYYTSCCIIKINNYVIIPHIVLYDLHNINIYCYYTSSCIIRNTFSCDTEIFIYHFI